MALKDFLKNNNLKRNLNKKTDKNNSSAAGEADGRGQGDPGQGGPQTPVARIAGIVVPVLAGPQLRDRIQRKRRRELL